MGLGTPGSLTVVCGVGHSRESHGSLLGLGRHSRESHGSLLGLGRHSRESHGSLCGWALQEVVSAGEEY